MMEDDEREREEKRRGEDAFLVAESNRNRGSNDICCIRIVNGSGCGCECECECE